MVWVWREGKDPSYSKWFHIVCCEIVVIISLVLVRNAVWSVVNAVMNATVVVVVYGGPGGFFGDFKLWYWLCVCDWMAN